MEVKHHHEPHEGEVRRMSQATSEVIPGPGASANDALGEILRQGKNYVNEGMYHLVWAPGICVFVTVTMFNVVGEGLRDALDPKLRR